MEIKLTIDRFEGDLAVLISEDKNKIEWPKNKLPHTAREGSVLTIYISDNIDKSEDDRKLAKDMLNEILDSGNTKHES